MPRASMPKAAVNEHCDLAGGERNVNLVKTVVSLESFPLGEEQPPDENLRFRVLATDG